MATLQYEVLRKDTREDVTGHRDWLIAPDGKLFAMREGTPVSPKAEMFDVIIIREVRDQ